MSKFTVKAETLQRFVALYKSLEPKASEDFKCFRIEIYKGKMILIGCNQFVACAEFLGETDQSDDICYIKVNNQLLDSIEKEVNIAGVYTFETLPELAMGTTFTSDGNKYNDFIIWLDESPLDNWRKWFKVSTESKDFMYCTLYQIQTLFETSPTGEIVFPEIINANEPVIVRDVNNANWLGTFIPAIDDKKLLKPATLPEWL